MRENRNQALRAIGEQAVCQKLAITRQRLRNVMCSDDPLPARWYWPLVQMGQPAPGRRKRIRISTEWFAWAEPKEEQCE